MNTYETAIIILMVLNILLGIDAWWLARQCNKADRKVKELDEELAKEKSNNRFVMPVAEVKTMRSDEDLEKIVKMLKESKVTRCDEDGIVIDKKCEHDHTYDSIILKKDELHCCEYLIFKCSTCGHEEKIRTTSHLLRDLILNGGLSV